MATVASKAELPPGSPIYRNDRGPKTCQLGEGRCGPSVVMLASYRICQEHLDRIAAIAEDAGVPFAPGVLA